ncbi:N-acetylglucosamine-6-phosphate deacetylase [Sphaerochaeta globosa]|uniref:N-acetylglucosamine-6-phosphate deacetylase n=1 Tax=Sphaerochaeta globosa (strain ATCC BAA-1886 / DSM 22777 / Buddy) TaxID=158189 RepID=F0RXY9_SPHGB|nr:N-acetylglucosamine-6-phosphate deacetylase [Sphaerochaeta globosa]ADY12413.1 N-acetylglucosamine-6-phosphate deacetylase [Sphaerochaeta globosa str. Buddy]
MTMHIRGAHVLHQGSFKQLDLLIESGRIVAMDKQLPPAMNTATFDATGLFLVPGFIDIHTHGALSIDFNHALPEDVGRISSFFASRGVTTYFPTLLTDTVETMTKQLDLLSSPQLLKDNPTIAGIHLEGPFLCPAYKGAMPGHLLRQCDLSLFRELYAASRKTMKVITLAPELEGAIPLIEEATSLGVRVSLGHSSASYEQTIAAIKAGATGTTHIMNAMKLLHMHDPAILTAVLEQDVYAEMICDGFHLHAPIIRLLLKIKGYDRMLAVTDSLSATGCPDGTYQLGVNTIIVKEGDAKVVETGVRAGSTLTMDHALRNLMSYTNEHVERISALVSTNAARMLGLQDVGELEIGKRADLVALDSDSQVQCTLANGSFIYGGERYA